MKISVISFTKTGQQLAQIEASKQTVSMLVIDKKRMPLKESGLPQMVIDQTPKLLRQVQDVSTEKCYICCIFL